MFVYMLSICVKNLVILLCIVTYLLSYSNTTMPMEELYECMELDSIKEKKGYAFTIMKWKQRGHKV